MAPREGGRCGRDRSGADAGLLFALAIGLNRLADTVKRTRHYPEFIFHRQANHTEMPAAESMLPCSTMRVLVTGGTGFLGRALLPPLQAGGYSVRVLARTPSGQQPRVEYRTGSVLTPESLADAVADCDAVIHLVGIISEYREQTFERVHVEGTRNLLTAARAAGITRWIQVSALGARPDAPARYHRTKWAAEELVRAAGLQWTVLRPSLVYGAGDGFTNLFARMSRWSPFLPLLGGGKTRVQPIAAADVAAAIVRCVDRPVAHQRTFDLCGPAALTWREVLAEILRAVDRRRWLVPIPWPLARLQARFLEMVYPRFCHQAPPLNGDQVLMLQEDNVGDPSLARRELDVDPRPFRLSAGDFRHSG